MALRGEALALEDMLGAASSRHISARTSCRLDNEVSANHPELKTRYNLAFLGMWSPS